MSRCWFADLPGAGPCDGRLVRCHLVPRQVLRRELGKVAGRRAAADVRSWVWGCGGPMGPGGHHGRLDSRGCNPLRIPRHRLPAELEVFAAQLGLSWWLDREYGSPSATA